MKISGFTVVRNGVLMGYPVQQSIRSLLPLVDEMVVGIGQSDDGTKELIESLKALRGGDKIRIFDSFWDPTKTRGGLMLSEKTNEALDRCENDWCFYLQADEIVHEMDLPRIHAAILKHDKDARIQGLLFDYVHFYGSYATIAGSRKWYRREVRLVRKSTGIRSHNDAQGFRVPTPEGLQKPVVASSDGRIFHYGWVKPPELMGQKAKLLDRWWHGNTRDHKAETFRYTKQYGLRPFTGTHPAVMRDLVKEQNWTFDHHRQLADWTFKDVNLLASDIFERIFHRRIGEYKPYKFITN